MKRSSAESLSSLESLRLPVSLFHRVKSGKITLFSNETEAFQISVSEKGLDIDALDENVLMDLFDAIKIRKSFLEQLEKIRNLAVALKNEELTITFSIEGNRVLTIGNNTSPKLSKFLMRTDAIEINNLGKLMKLLL